MLQAVAARYENVFVWADDVWDAPHRSARAQELRSLVSGQGKALRSVKQGGLKRDANQYLQDGLLPEFLSRVLGKPFQP